MKIAFRDEKGKPWKKASVKVYKDEKELQNLLHQYPDLIPLDDIGDQLPELKVCISEAGLPGSGSTDLIAVDEAGGITIVECKLATNPEVKRKVIGQVLEYAAYLWRMPYDQFDDIVKSRCDASLTDAMRQKLTPDPAWSEDDFRQAVSANLKEGRFRLIVVVDAMNDELRRVVEYLNSRSAQSFEIFALELRYFSHDNVELLLPQIHGTSPVVPPPSLAWDEDRFFTDLVKRNSDPVVTAVRSVFDFVKANAGKVIWGIGRKDGSFSFYLLKGSHAISVFTVATNGRLWIALRIMSGTVPQKMLEEFIANLRQLAGFESLTDDLTKWPGFSVQQTLCNAATLSGFEQAVLALKQKILDSTQIA